MNNIYQGKKEAVNHPVAIEDALKPECDSQILQEIIDILKHPFQTTCTACNGLGFVNSGQDCRVCDGNGKLLDKAFK